MPRLHLHITKQLAERIQENAGRAHLSLSSYIALFLERDVERSWPSDYFDVFGGWQGEPLERAPQGEYEERAWRQY